MKKEKATEYLNSQKLKLNQLDLDEIHWIDETVSIVEVIFGENSRQSEQISELTLSIDDSFYDDGTYHPGRNRDRAKRYIDTFINQLDLHYEKKLQSQKESTNTPFIVKHFGVTITIVLALITGAFSFGLYFGNIKFDKEKIDLSNKNEALASDTTNLNLIINQKDIWLTKQKTILELTRDSLRESEETVESLSFYIMGLQKDKNNVR